jgi:hypothetical protein
LWIKDSVITSYVELVRVCDRIGCAAITEQEYKKMFPVQVSDPSEGIIVLEPFRVIDEKTGKEYDEEVSLERLYEKTSITQQETKETVSEVAEKPRSRKRSSSNPPATQES